MVGQPAHDKVSCVTRIMYVSVLLHHKTFLINGFNVTLFKDVPRLAIDNTDIGDFCGEGGYAHEEEGVPTPLLPSLNLAEAGEGAAVVCRSVIHPHTNHDLGDMFKAITVSITQ